MNKKIISYLGASVAGAAGLAGSVVFTHKSKELKNERQLVYKNDKIIQTLEQFLTIKQNGLYLERYFKDNGYKTIAIYGMGCLGRRLYDELKNSEIQISYVIDKKAKDLECDINILTPNKDLPMIDAVVVTPIFYYMDIEKELDQYLDCPIISLEDVLDEVQLSTF